MFSIFFPLLWMGRWLPSFAGHLFFLLLIFLFTYRWTFFNRSMCLLKLDDQAVDKVWDECVSYISSRACPGPCGWRQFSYWQKTFQFYILFPPIRLSSLFFTFSPLHWMNEFHRPSICPLFISLFTTNCSNHFTAHCSFHFTIHHSFYCSVFTSHCSFHQDLIARSCTLHVMNLTLSASILTK